MYVRTSTTVQLLTTGFEMVTLNRGATAFMMEELWSVYWTTHATLHGRYGGDEGKPAGLSDGLVYGFYSINACEQSPVRIHYWGPIPIRTEPIDGTEIANCNAFISVLGRGRTQGIKIVRPDQDDLKKHCINLKNIITYNSRGESDGPERDGTGRDGSERDDLPYGG